MAEQERFVECMFCKAKAVRTLVADKGTENEITYRVCLDHVMTALDKVGLSA